jgi:hypothetical protein
MNSLLKIFTALSAMHPQRFWLIWFSTTIVSLIYLMTVVGHGAIPSRQKTSRPSINVILTRLEIWNPRTIVALTLLITFLAFYIAMIFVGDDFAYYDDDLLMLYALKGHNFPPPIWQSNGRFFPFGMFEFNLIRHLTNTPIGYQMLPIVELIIFFCILFILDAELDVTARAGLAILTLMTPSVLLSFGGLIYEERNVLFLLAALVLSVSRFARTKAVTWAVVVVICAQIMLYYKETTFLNLFAFAGARLMLRCRNEHETKCDWNRLLDQESRLDWCLASLAVLFLLCYVAVMGVHRKTSYVSIAHHPLADVVLDYLRLDLLVWLFVAIVLARIYLILRRRAMPSLLWDGLALGGVAYFLAYLGLRMFTAYYMAPADMIAVLYVGRIVVLSWEKIERWKKVATVTLALVIVVQNLLLATFALFERKNVVHAKVEIASVVEALYRTGSGKVPSLFFPFANPYVIMEFLVYLNYRGVPINSAALLNRPIGRDAPCIEYRETIRCHPTSSPAPGDLVIVLPDDEASLAEAATYREPGKLLFFYNPRPSIVHWLYPLIGSFPLAAGDYNKPRPDRWMDASVAVWK